MQLKKRKTDYHRGNLPAAVIQGGIELIEEKGIRALTLREIGKGLPVLEAIQEDRWLQRWRRNSQRAATSDRAGAFH